MKRPTNKIHQPRVVTGVERAERDLDLRTWTGLRCDKIHVIARRHGSRPESLSILNRFFARPRRLNAPTQSPSPKTSALFSLQSREPPAHQSPSGGSICEGPAALVWVSVNDPIANHFTWHIAYIRVFQAFSLENHILQCCRQRLEHVDTEPIRR